MEREEVASACFSEKYSEQFQSSLGKGTQQGASFHPPGEEALRMLIFISASLASSSKTLSIGCQGNLEPYCGTRM